MERLDLHGIPHFQVNNDIIRKIEEFWNSNTEIHFITGNSEEMKQIVIEILNEYNLEYRIGDIVNKGYIKTIV